MKREGRDRDGEEKRKKKGRRERRCLHLDEVSNAHILINTGNCLNFHLNGRRFKWKELGQNIVVDVKMVCSYGDGV